MTASHEVPELSTIPVEFYAYPEVPADAVEQAKSIVKAARLDVGGIEYLETDTGRRVFYDINANSNLRPSVAAVFGFDPFERVVDYLVEQARLTGPDTNAFAPGLADRDLMQMHGGVMGAVRPQLDTGSGRAIVSPLEVDQTSRKSEL